MRLAELRLRRGLTQRDLAKKLGVSPGAVANWEAGLRMPRVPMLCKIAAVLDVTIDEMLHGPAESKGNR